MVWTAGTRWQKDPRAAGRACGGKSCVGLAPGGVFLLLLLLTFFAHVLIQRFQQIVVVLLGHGRVYRDGLLGAAGRQRERWKAVGGCWVPKAALPRRNDLDTPFSPI